MQFDRSSKSTESNDKNDGLGEDGSKLSSRTIGNNSVQVTAIDSAERRGYFRKNCIPWSWDLTGENQI